MILIRTLVYPVASLCLACRQYPPAATSSFIGRWEFVVATRLGVEGDSADGMHMGFWITGARGDSVFGKVFMYSDEHPENADSCGLLRGVRSEPSNLTLVYADATGEFRITAKLRNDTLVMDHMRSNSGADLPWGSRYIFTRRDDKAFKGCRASIANSRSTR